MASHILAKFALAGAVALGLASCSSQEDNKLAASNYAASAPLENSRGDGYAYHTWLQPGGSTIWDLF